MFSIFRKETQALKLCMLVNLGMLLFSLFGMMIDDRMLLGENVWLKPAKFGISLVIYCITIALLLNVYPYSIKIKQRISRIIGWAMILEAPPVMIQAARGVRSHFNDSTPLDGILFGIMGLLILINSLALLYMMGTAFFKKLDTTKTMQRAIQLAWLAMIISMVAGQQMISANAHSVGVPDGGPGMFLTHWSIEGGDWRAVHFLGLHGIQLFPLLAILFEKRNISQTISHWSISIIGLLYLGFISYIYMQTKMGIPLIP